MIGSMSIQMISLRKNFEAFMRRSDVRIGLLREVVEKLQNGEQVDVEKVLGTGDAEREAEWEEGRFKPATTWFGLVMLTWCVVINEIEKDNATKNQKKQNPKVVETAVPVAKLIAATESKAGYEPVNESPKGRTANFF